ncbi:MAG: hypothetical protein KGL39_33945 [Patescibacteria group bacterium]|nr:hypothetical protein [Patescibacteria group bacterium]
MNLYVFRITTAGTVRISNCIWIKAYSLDQAMEMLNKQIAELQNTFQTEFIANVNFEWILKEIEIKPTKPLDLVEQKEPSPPSKEDFLNRLKLSADMFVEDKKEKMILDRIIRKMQNESNAGKRDTKRDHSSS